MAPSLETLYWDEPPIEDHFPEDDPLKLFPQKEEKRPSSDLLYGDEPPIEYSESFIENDPLELFPAHKPAKDPLGLFPAHKPPESPQLSPPGLPSIAAAPEALPTKEEFLAQRPTEIKAPIYSPGDEAKERIGSALAGTARQFGLGITLGYGNLFEVYPELKELDERFAENIPIKESDPLITKAIKSFRNDPNILAKMPARLLGEILTIGRVSRAVSTIAKVPQTIKAAMKTAGITGLIVGGARKPETEGLGERVQNAVVSGAFFVGTTGAVLGIDKLLQLRKIKSLDEFRQSFYELFVKRRNLPDNEQTRQLSDQIIDLAIKKAGGINKIKRGHLQDAIQRVKKSVSKAEFRREGYQAELRKRLKGPVPPPDVPGVELAPSPPAPLDPLGIFPDTRPPSGVPLLQPPTLPEEMPQKPVAPIPPEKTAPARIKMTQLNLAGEVEKTPKFPGVSESFLKQPKPKTNILQYFTPAEYHLKELGFDAKLGQPVREALQDFSIELMEKNDFVVGAQKDWRDTLARRNKHWKDFGREPITEKRSSKIIYDFMDKGIPPDKVKTIEARTARAFREQTVEMLDRLNDVRRLVGEEPVIGVKNYILHMLQPEVLNEIYAKGVIPPELAKIMEHIPPKKLFLRTAQQRKGVPEEWLVKDPFQLMKAMYAIDLRYIHLQRALHEIDPYLRAVKGYQAELPEGGTDEWSPETYKYLDDWIKQAIKMRPSNIDVLFDNLLNATIAPVLRRRGVAISHMPWRDAVNFLSAASHTGALGMRIKPILRNLVQSSFDWVMYGTKSYAKGSRDFMTPKGHEILKKSKIWRTRMPFEAQDLATLQKVFKTGSLGYRAADLHNVGKGILTRYHHAIDNLKMSPTAAIKWADKDVPGTQWSYRREDLPRAYWTSTGRAVWTLGSWWMNFYRRFLPEIMNKTFKGVDVEGREVPLVERMSGLRFIGLIALLYGIKEKSKELTGTAIDYTGQVSPTPLREGPVINLGRASQKIIAGLTGKQKWLFKQGLGELKRTSKIFVPYYLAAEEYYDYWTGAKTGGELLFYGSPKKGLTLTDVIEELPFWPKPEKIYWKDVLKNAKAQKVNQIKVRDFMEKKWKTRKYGDLSREARRELLEHFSEKKEQR